MKNRKKKGKKGKDKGHVRKTKENTRIMKNVKRMKTWRIDTKRKTRTTFYDQVPKC